ncbi:radical SAM protein [Bradyrhizobium diazoefficiens]|uniref:radical SAM protein n=1 Tax=Bradyrhizobium diazoefficiens TaxID=1355477 RepID=UPI00359849B7
MNKHMNGMMSWPTPVDHQFEKVVHGIPLMFRPIVRPKLRKAAEARCLGRNSALVNEADLFTALFDITPKQFKGECVKLVESLGVEVMKYINLKDIRDQYAQSWEQFGKAFHPGNYHITLYMTDRCNETCKHCAVHLNSRPDLPMDKWIDIVDDVETTLRKQGRHGVYIYFGGEPLVRKDLRRIIEHSGERGYFHALATNGLLFKKEYAKFCVQNRMNHVFISLDSTNTIKASMIRGVKRSGELAERAIKTALDAGLFVIVNAVIMKQNLDEMQEIKDMVERWGAVCYMRAVIKSGTAALHWDEIGLTNDEYRQFYDFKYKHAVEAVRKGYVGTLPIFDIWDWTPFMDIPLDDKEQTALEWGVGCQACRTISGIDVNGDFLPCYYPTKLKLGNLVQTPFETIMQSQLFNDIRDRKKTSGKCTGCGHRSMCGGGCGVHSECETGDFFSSVPYCWHEPKADDPSVVRIGGTEIRLDKLTAGTSSGR